MPILAAPVLEGLLSRVGRPGSIGRRFGARSAHNQIVETITNLGAIIDGIPEMESRDRRGVFAPVQAACWLVGFNISD